MQTILASAVRTVSGVAAITGDFGNVSGMMAVLDVTAAATGAGDKLNVYLQASIDGGTTWDDFVHFTEVLGNGGVKKFVASWSRDAAPESEIREQADAAMAAGVLQGPVGPTWRAKYVIVNAGGGVQSFTFGVTMRAVRDNDSD